MICLGCHAWGTQRYMDMNRLKEMQETEAVTPDNAAAKNLIHNI